MGHTCPFPWRPAVAIMARRRPPPHIRRHTPMDEAAKKTALRMIPYGMFVLTSRSKDGQEVGTATVNWITQASFSPHWSSSGSRPTLRPRPRQGHRGLCHQRHRPKSKRTWPSTSSRATSGRATPWAARVRGGEGDGLRPAAELARLVGVQGGGRGGQGRPHGIRGGGRRGGRPAGGPDDPHAGPQPELRRIASSVPLARNRGRGIRPSPGRRALSACSPPLSPYRSRR